MVYLYHSGTSDAYCGEGCQSMFGKCTAASRSGSGSGSDKITPDGTCGGADAYTCKGGAFGKCCSQYGFCGDSDQYCLNACQPSFGDCSSVNVDGKSMSSDGTCAGAGGFTCQGSSYGNCCSQWGYCGSSGEYCGNGCQASFGTCGASGGRAEAATSAVTSAATSAATQTATGIVVSPDGSCGGTNRYTCPTGQCCSKRGYCGTTSDFCGFGCQSAFSPGTCAACPGSTCAGTVTGISSPMCPASNNFCWTLNAKKFQVICGRLASGDSLAAADAATLGDCVSKCAASAVCVAASFFQGPSTSCILFSSYRGPADGNSAGGSQSHAYVRSAACV
ncbi:putative agglutinin isolectin 1 [Colletotrichum sublineola]|uniref:Putative agglutinin isolectin 1 n=1 Tax=Colletotrichum sublineola TaxID=1173701 RepID=A0A066XY08_COLSU|nr:putative agglutinin isolectin 1 [Colletotrichum sublineola]